ncbi:TRAP transporter substrate-binding protein DctP [Brucella anthropi]|nr:TRAP transporter substrate-binding protein DctP [Brucella anthropi]
MARKISIFALSALVALASITSAMAKTTLNYSHYGPDRGTDAEILHQFAQEIDTGTAGEVQVRITFGGALLSTQETARGVGSRVADMGTFIAAFNPTEFLNYLVVDLPVTPSNPWVGVRTAMDLVESDALVKGEFDRMNLKLLANFATGPIILMCRERIDTLAAMQGEKFRIQPPHSRQFEQFGVVSVSVSTPEVYQSLDRGYITCAQGYITSMVPYRQYEVAKYVLEIEQGQALGYGTVINKQVFESLTSEHQAVVVDAGKKLAERFAEKAVASLKNDRAALTAEHGVQFLKLSEEDQKTLDAAAEVPLDLFREAANPQVLNHVINLAEKYQAELAADGYPWDRVAR